MTRKRIAVVEDNRDNRLVIRAIVDGRYDLIEYGTGADALAGIRRDPPDLVLLDISLPAMDGTEVLRRLRDDPALAGLPVIALTAHAMRGDRERLFAAGFDEYVAKPIIDEEGLLAAIEHWLESTVTRHGA
jgi:two-component system cell cycle response regulator DivK